MVFCGVAANSPRMENPRLVTPPLDQATDLKHDRRFKNWRHAGRDQAAGAFTAANPLANPGCRDNVGASCSAADWKRVISVPPGASLRFWFKARSETGGNDFRKSRICGDGEMAEWPKAQVC